jgi:hypothetical protein
MPWYKDEIPSVKERVLAQIVQSRLSKASDSTQDLSLLNGFATQVPLQITPNHLSLATYAPSV